MLMKKGCSQSCAATLSINENGGEKDDIKFLSMDNRYR